MCLSFCISSLSPSHGLHHHSLLILLTSLCFGLKQPGKVGWWMETFPTHTHQHRGHDGNPPAGRRGAFRNKTWVSGERSNSSSPFQAGHLGADAPRWERGGVTRGAGRGRGRGKGRSPSPSEEPVLETLEERERHYQEVSPTTVTTRVDPRRNRATCA